MFWMTWRQHRLAIFSVGTAFLALAGYYFMIGNSMRSEIAPGLLSSCFSAGVGECGSWPLRINEVLNFSYLLPALGMVAGIFLGAPLLARELEQRTYRYAWTQGVSRTNWLTTKLVLLGAAVVLFSTAVSAAQLWWYAPANSNFDIFGQTGTVFPAVCLFGFVAGVAAGALAKRLLTAITVTLVGFLAVVIPVQALLRPNYLAPLTTTKFADIRDGWMTAFPFVDAQGRSYDVFDAKRAAGLPGGSSFGSADTAQLEALGFQRHYLYQPGERFWTFQFIETGIFLAAAAGCVALTFWLLRNRLA